MATTVETLAGPPAQLPEDRLEELRAQLRGGAFGPGEPGPADSHPPFNAMYPDEAAITVRCSGTADVVDAITFARSHGLLVAVRGGGHSIAGLSSSRGGHAPRPRRRCAASSSTPSAASPTSRAAPCGATSTARPSASAWPRPAAWSPTPGVAGLTLGGGYGWLRRKYGLSSDNVVAAQVVLADGRVVTASEDQNPDLFWALRGGGGNFGVVTAFTFRLHPVGPGGRLLGDLLPARGARLDPARLPRRDGAVPRRRHGDHRHDDVPRQPRAARGHPRPPGGHRRRRARRRRPPRAWRPWRRCASSARRCSTCPARRRSSACRPASTRSSRARSSTPTGSRSTSRSCPTRSSTCSRPAPTTGRRR